MINKGVDMNISIIGGSGFVGRNLINKLLKNKHSITNIDLFPIESEIENLKNIRANTQESGQWQDEIKKSDIVINLAGATIFNFWSKKYKELIYNSRILTTKNIVDALDASRKTTLLNTSAAGFYGDRKNDLLKENEPSGNDFLANVCTDWENQAFKAKDKNSRVIIMRFGIVLGNGGALAKMIPLTKMMMNPVFGSGKNYFPWIHVKDICNAVEFLIENKDFDGIYNFVSPDLKTQKEFTRELASSVKRMAPIHIPGFLVSTFGGDLGKSFLCSQRASSEKLLNQGFKFQFSILEKALLDIV